MAYYINIFSPDTYKAYSESSRTVSGFKENQKGIANIKPGDKLICYVTKLSRWVGLLEVKGGYKLDRTPLFSPIVDPYILRFNIDSKVWLPLDLSLPIDTDEVWNGLSFTKAFQKGHTGWTIMVRSSLRRIEDADGALIERLLLRQKENGTIYALSESDERKLKSPTVRTSENKQVAVSIPEKDDTQVGTKIDIQINHRDSIKIQALLAEIGERMNLKIWIPRSDRQRVIEVWHPRAESLLELLPLNYDDATLKTIENIDVLWIRGRSIVRAFKVEHTTSIYSGILRMADLMALQPNLNINAHIVAPVERKDKVLQEISRPVFTLLDKGPLSESCSFISYSSVEELSNEKRLEYMNDTVLEEYSEWAE
ncbi:MAG: hypothetical protein EOP56_05165 [Sphingobacteriales bacterium]|nr:MAG: hypothetical protein EOP56_05165 [Sphingobacteriales bacterium]